jgi:hypothetical protein
MDLFVPLNLLVFAVAAWQNLRRIRRGNPHNGLRWVALCISLYIGGIYFLTILGAIPEGEIRLYMRWFQIPIGMYLILEALYG